MFRRLMSVTLALAMLISGPLSAAVKRKPASTRKAVGAKSASKAAAKTASDFGVNLRPMTTAETQANAIWNLRAALNIAALQCQYSPYLATVSLYNAIQKQDADEFDRAKSTMMGHFRRYGGGRAETNFDQYTTKTYNAYSTLDAQLAFCDRAAIIGREVLAVRQGQLATIALDRVAQVRASLVRVKPLSFLGSVDLEPMILPSFDEADGG